MTIRPLKHIFRQGLTLLLISCVLGLLVNRLRPNSVPLFRHYVPAGTYQITVAVARPLLDFQRDHQRILFVDLRPPDTYRNGSIPGAINAEDPELLPRALKAPGVVCFGDNLDQAVELAAQLRERGVLTCVALAEGWKGWLAVRSPIERP